VKHSDSHVLLGIKPHHRSSRMKGDDMIAKILVSAAIALGCCVGGAALVRAETDPVGTDPNPFGALGCSCPETASPGSPVLMEELERGIWGGLSASPSNRDLS
jgi:hypothetical protein